MRIAHVSATYPPYRAGTGNVCEAQARELARRGHAVHVFTAASPSQPGLAAYEAIDGVHLHRLRPLLQVGNAPVIPALALALRRFDVVHLHYPFVFGAELVRLAAALTRTPLVLSFHNDLIGQGLRGAFFTQYQRASAAVSVATAARLCAVSLDHYHSSHLAASLARPTADRPEFVVELPNGVDIRHFSYPGSRIDFDRYRIPSDARILAFVAALDHAHHFKGLDRLLVAMPRLPQDTWLLVVGDGELRAGYERQARTLGIAERTVFAGRVDHDALPAFYRSSHVTVLPSSPPESFGMVLIESLACGTPVVASRIPGVRTVVEDGGDGLLVDTANPETLAHAITSLLADDDRRSAMGRRGREKVERCYAWESIGARLEAIYTDVLAEQTRRRSSYGAREVQP